MAESSSELVYEILKTVQTRTMNLELASVEHAAALNALRGHAASIQTDTNNIHSVPIRIDARLDRIGGRLELRELAEAQRPIDPT